jgi:hypothetical protein
MAEPLRRSEQKFIIPRLLLGSSVFVEMTWFLACKSTVFSLSHISLTHSRLKESWLPKTLCSTFFRCSSSKHRLLQDKPTQERERERERRCFWLLWNASFRSNGRSNVLKRSNHSAAPSPPSLPTRFILVTWLAHLSEADELFFRSAIFAIPVDLSLLFSASFALSQPNSWSRHICRCSSFTTDFLTHSMIV